MGMQGDEWQPPTRRNAFRQGPLHFSNRLNRRQDGVLWCCTCSIGTSNRFRVPCYDTHHVLHRLTMSHMLCFPGSPPISSAVRASPRTLVPAQAITTAIVGSWRRTLPNSRSTFSILFSFYLFHLEGLVAERAGHNDILLCGRGNCKGADPTRNGGGGHT